MTTLRQDIRYGARVLSRSPVTTAVAILSLALGIGANTAIFSLLNALILRPLPIPNAEQLVRLSTTTPQDPEREDGLTLAMYRQLRQDQRVFSDLFGWNGGGIVNLEANGVKYVASFTEVTGEYFSTLGVPMHLGRAIAPEDLRLDSGKPAPVAVIGYGCWQRRYQGDPGVIGKTIRVEDRPLTIVGVTPRNFAGIDIDVAPDVTVPFGYSGRTTYRDRKVLALDAFARLKPGVSLEQARPQLAAIWPAARLAALPDGYGGAQRDRFLSRRLGVSSAVTGRSYLRTRYRLALSVLMAMVGLLLLTACANLANLMLARAAARRREFGLRMALGAARGRIVRQLLTESLMLSAPGALLGIGVAHWASALLLATMTSGALVPLSVDASPDLRVLAFTALVSLLTAVLFGLAPASSIFKIDLRGRDRTGVGALAKVLLGAQVALSLVLVMGAVLFVRSLDRLRSVDTGFRREGLLVLQLFPHSGQPMPGRMAYYRELVERLGAIPGVESVSYSHMGPTLSYEYKEAAASRAAPGNSVQAVFEAVGPGFFHLAGMHVLAGREFDWRDGEGARPVAIVSESLSRRLFPSENPIGKTIDFGSRKGLEIAGVVNSASLWLPQSREPLAVYVAFLQEPAYNSSSVVIRTAGNPEGAIPEVRRVLASLGRHVALRIQTVDQRATSFLTTDRMIAMLSSFFGGLALLLVSIGLYGLMSYAVARRTSEIGLRMALGAQPASVLRLIFKDVARLVLAGMVVGVPVALIASRLVAGMVFNVAATDPLVLAASCALLAIVAMIAGYVPARRASRIDPMTALRSE